MSAGAGGGLEAWKWRQQQRDGSRLSCGSGSGSAGVADACFSQPSRARQLFCIVRRCAFTPPTLKREASSGAACLTCGSRRRCGVRRTCPM